MVAAFHLVRAKYRLFYVSLRIQTYFRTLLNSLHPKSNVCEPESLNDFCDVNLLLCCWSIGIRIKVNLELILATSLAVAYLGFWKDFSNNLWIGIFQFQITSKISGDIECRFLCWTDYLKLWIRFMPLLSPNKIVRDTSKITENDCYNERKIIWHRAQTLVDIVSKFNQSWPEEVVNR